MLEGAVGTDQAIGHKGLNGDKEKGDGRGSGEIGEIHELGVRSHEEQ